LAQDVFIEEIDVTPAKKIFQSIASDIDLKKGILELVDDAIDEWRLRQRPTLKVELWLDVANKVLSYEDDAGGIREQNLNMVIQPGGTTRKPHETSIGEFGLGLKRAIVALSREAEVISRFESEGTFKIKVDDSWLTSNSWKIPKWRTTEIQPGRTIINITKVKFDIDIKTVNEVRQNLAETYGLLLSNILTIWLNGELVEPVKFENWAYPPQGNQPRTYKTAIRTDRRKVNIDITAGLMPTSSPTGDFGFCIYCNDRLILKHYKDREIGFTTGLLGYPHPAVAWFRGVVRITGANQDMPWNSTKSGLDFSNPIVPVLKDNILKLCKPYLRLARRLGEDSANLIAPHSKGEIETVDLTKQANWVLKPEQMPNIPQKRRSEADHLLRNNEETVSKRPWTRAIIEQVFAADLIAGKHVLENKNRFALILLDSCLEVAFRDYLFLVKGLKLTKEQRKELLSRRESLIDAMKKNSKLDDETWKSIEYFYELRCSSYHELGAPEIAESDLDNFRELVSEVLFSLHQLVIPS